MTGNLTNKTLSDSCKFKTLKIEQNSILLIRKNKEKTSILYSELKKIYITKHKISFSYQIGLLAILLISTLLTIVYLPFEVLIFKSIADLILIARMNTFKKYRICIIGKEDTHFTKFFNKNTKQESVNTVAFVRKKIFETQNKYNKQLESESRAMPVDEFYNNPALKIA